MRELLFKLAGLTLLVASFAVGWQWMRYQGFSETPLTIDESGYELLITPGTPMARVAAGLRADGVIDDERLLVWMARLRGVGSKIKAGEYLLEPGLTPPQLLELLVAGKVVQYTLTVIEGWTFHQMLAALAANPHIDHTLDGLDDAAVMARLGYPGEHPEGRFLPETYHFPQGLSDVDFLRRAYAAMADLLEREWASRAEGLPISDPYEALILASIIEKETGVPDERPQIAGVFVRRLQKRMRLQTDPTIIYGLGDAYDGNLRRRHLVADDNPYNTYRISGLPPTPIALPSAEALRAALHPADGKALYFVARGDGSHAFSDTLEQHNKAVIRYQLNGRARPFSSNPAGK